jgi:hypothetical protein
MRMAYQAAQGPLPLKAKRVSFQENKAISYTEAQRLFALNRDKNSSKNHDLAPKIIPNVSRLQILDKNFLKLQRLLQPEIEKNRVSNLSHFAP